MVSGISKNYSGRAGEIVTETNLFDYNNSNKNAEKIFTNAETINPEVVYDKHDRLSDQITSSYITAIKSGSAYENHKIQSNLSALGFYTGPMDGNEFSKSLWIKPGRRKC